MFCSDATEIGKKNKKKRIRKERKENLREILEREVSRESLLILFSLWDFLWCVEIGKDCEGCADDIHKMSPHPILNIFCSN